MSTETKATATETAINTRRIVTFAVGGPLRGYYMDIEVRPGENDSLYSAENVIRLWCAEHFPKDWVATYGPAEFLPQIHDFGRLLLCQGRIERFNTKNYFHEARD